VGCEEGGKVIRGAVVTLSHNLVPHAWRYRGWMDVCITTLLKRACDIIYVQTNVTLSVHVAFLCVRVPSHISPSQHAHTLQHLQYIVTTHLHAHSNDISLHQHANPPPPPPAQTPFHQKQHARLRDTSRRRSSLPHLPDQLHKHVSQPAYPALRPRRMQSVSCALVGLLQHVPGV
jgi:hypothetical protein